MISHHLMVAGHFHLELEEPRWIFHASHLDKYPLPGSSYVWLSAIYQAVLVMANTSVQEMWPVEI